MNVLLVDASRVTLKIVGAMVTERGDRCVAYDDGAKALAHMQEHKDVDVLITGLELPGLGGLDLCWAARTLRLDDQCLHIIVMSSAGSGSKLVEALDSGADDFMRKPVETAELQARLRNAERSIRDRREIVRLAATDPLTGCLNRRAFLTEVDRSVRDSPQAAPGVFVMMDLDRFKKINDTYGHDAGDAAILMVCDVVRRHGQGAFGRLGGEEFGWVLPGQTIDDGLEIVDRLRCAIAGEPLLHDGHRIPVTASFGVTALDHDTSVDATLKQADLALYRAKQNGRNRAELHRPAAVLSALAAT
ncbi:GGDEF domain-containing protein [Methylobrevis albus]|uniref:diguanylate cyclase n=1 Tax=Methylobrevis albus TaxID=2793297 RepID=A0A931I1P2_9HYPH|nr:diguanylate cyclase [Methylobrevis albus]MBH0238182.1 diguanylate cyclase [Methylobrevis albus]